jgi:hypothetical protein
MAPDFRWPYTYQLNFSIQREFSHGWTTSVGYVGSLGHRLPFAIDLNYPYYHSTATTGNVNNRGPIQPGVLSNIYSVESVMNTSYNSMQVTVDKRLARHVQLKAFYVFSKALEDVQLDNNTVNGGAEDYRNLALDRGRSDNDRRHVAVGSLIWNIDYFGSRRRLLRNVLNRWQLSAIVTLQSGLPFGITSGTDTNLDGTNNDRPTLVGNPYLDPNRSRDQTTAVWFNTAAFAKPANGVDGNVARNLMDRPGSKNVDAGLFRNFKLMEQMTLQIRAEFTNAFNLVNLGAPTATLSSAQFGQIRSAGSMRQMQLGLRLTFKSTPRADRYPKAGSPFSSHHFHPRHNLFPGYQSTPVGHDLPHSRPSFPEARRPRRPIQNERDQLAREPVHCLFVLPPHADPDLHFRRIRVRRRGLPVTGIDAEELRVDLLELQAEPIEPLPHDPVRRLCLLQRLRPRVHQRADGLPSIHVSNRELQTRRTWTATNGADPHTIRPSIRQTNAGKIGHAIRRDVVPRIAQLVEQLLFHRIDHHSPARTSMLGHHEAAVGLGLHNRIPNICHVRNALPIHLAVAARTLCAALDDMSRDRSGRQLVELFRSPTVAVDHRRERQRRIRRSARDHHVRPGGKRLRQGKSADVRVRAQDPIADGPNGLAHVHIAHLVAFGQELVQARKNIISEHHGHLQPGRQPYHLPRAGHRIHSARIRNHRHPALPHRLGDARNQRRKIARVSQVGIGLLLLLQD